MNHGFRSADFHHGLVLLLLKNSQILYFSPQEVVDRWKILWISPRETCISWWMIRPQIQGIGFDQ